MTIPFLSVHVQSTTRRRGVQITLVFTSSQQDWIRNSLIDSPGLRSSGTDPMLSKNDQTAWDGLAQLGLD